MNEAFWDNQKKKHTKRINIHQEIQINSRQKNTYKTESKKEPNTKLKVTNLHISKLPKKGTFCNKKKHTTKGQKLKSYH